MTALTRACEPGFQVCSLDFSHGPRLTRVAKASLGGLAVAYAFIFEAGLSLARVGRGHLRT